MEGLEAVEINFPVVKRIIDFRIDPETYRKIYLETDEKLNNSITQSIDTLSVSVQNFGAYSLCNYIVFVDEGVRYLMTQNVKDNYIDFDGIAHITPEVHEILYKSHCKRGQVLLTMAGAYLGKAAVFDKDFDCSSNQAIAKITLKQSKVSPYYLSTFLNSKFGQNQIQRFRTTTGQPNINMSLIKELKVVMLSDTFQLAIETHVIKTLELLEESKKIYAKAENLLLKHIDLGKWIPPKDNTSVKFLKESFLQTGRLDAEYYQPKYFEIVEHVKQQNFDYLGNLVNVKKSIEPGSDAYLNEGIPFIRVADLSKFGLSDPEIFLDPNEYDIEHLMPRKDNILLSKDGSVGIAYKIEEDKEVITSGAILHLSITDKRVLPDYLCLVLNSIVVQYQAERDAGGSIIQHWKPDEIKQVVIPILSPSVQEKITELVQESFALQNQSKQLLDAAKHAVELAIEQNEEVANQWLKIQNITQ